jgi:hypothetical protein
MHGEAMRPAAHPIPPLTAKLLLSRPPAAVIGRGRLAVEQREFGLTGEMTVLQIADGNLTQGRVNKDGLPSTAL